MLHWSITIETLNSGRRKEPPNLPTVCRTVVRSEDQLNVVVESTPGAIMTTDPIGMLELDKESRGKFKVLVVDDMELNREVAQSVLHEAGYEVSVAEDGAEAVQAATVQDFDMVLMDVRMPRMGGIEATRQIRKFKGRRGEVPIIGLTAQASAQQIDECLRAGMTSHLAKPYSLDALVEKVQETARRVSGKGIVLAFDNSGPSQPASAARSSGLPSQDTMHVCQPAEPVASEALLDKNQFVRSTVYVEPDLVATYVESLVQRAEDLLGKLAADPERICCSNTVAEAAHALAGSAGLLGFARLSSAARRFEHAVDVNLLVSESAGELVTIIQDSVREMKDVLAAPMAARRLESADTVPVIFVE